MDAIALVDAEREAAELTPWPLNPFDAALVAQTYEGRPMTTHHVLEFEVDVDIDRVRAAAVALVKLYPELASRVVVGGVHPTRWYVPASPDEIHDRVTVDHDGSHTATERWIRRPIDPTQTLPFAVRLAPGREAARSLTLSLHHSVTDGRGALQVFDRLLDLVATGRARPRRRPAPVALPDSTWGGVVEAVKGVARVFRSACDLSAPEPSSVAGHRIVVATLAPQTWRALGRRARADEVSRNTLLWRTAALAVEQVRQTAASGPGIRILGPVDLRAQLGVPDEALQNWLGTMALDVDPAGDVQALHAALRRARELPEALATTRLVGAVGKLPWGIAGRVFKQADASPWPAPYTMMLSLLRPRAACWPASLHPCSLWCTSLLPRKPGLGVTVTVVDDRVTIAASSHAATLAAVDAERLVARLAGALETM